MFLAKNFPLKLARFFLTWISSALKVWLYIYYFFIIILILNVLLIDSEISAFIIKLFNLENIKIYIPDVADSKLTIILTIIFPAIGFIFTRILIKVFRKKVTIKKELVIIAILLLLLNLLATGLIGIKTGFNNLLQFFIALSIFSFIVLIGYCIARFIDYVSNLLKKNSHTISP